MTVEINGVEFTTADWLALVRADGRIAPDGPTAILDAFQGEQYESAVLAHALRAILGAGTNSERAIAAAALHALTADG